MNFTDSGVQKFLSIFLHFNATFQASFRISDQRLFHEKTTADHARHLRQWGVLFEHFSLDHQVGSWQLWNRLEPGTALLLVLAKLGHHAGLELDVDGVICMPVPFGQAGTGAK